MFVYTHNIQKNFMFLLALLGKNYVIDKPKTALFIFQIISYDAQIFRLVAHFKNVRKQ